MPGPLRLCGDGKIVRCTDGKWMIGCVNGCYQRWTATFDCSTNSWTGPAAGAKKCLSGPSLEWRKIGSIGGLCSYEIYVDLATPCTADVDCSGLDDSTDPGLPYAGAMPPDCCQTNARCDICLPAPPPGAILPASINFAGISPADPSIDARCGVGATLPPGMTPADCFIPTANLVWDGSIWLYQATYVNGNGDTAQLTYQIQCGAAFPLAVLNETRISRPTAGSYLGTVVNGGVVGHWTASFQASVATIDGTMSYQGSGLYPIDIGCLGGKPSGTWSQPIYANGGTPCMNGQYRGDLIITV